MMEDLIEEQDLGESCTQKDQGKIVKSIDTGRF